MKPQRSFAMVVAMAGLAGAAALGPGTAAAQVLEQQAAKPKLDNWQVVAGVRTTLVRSDGYDPFSTNDALTQFSVSMERVVVRRDAFVFAAGIVTDYGLASAHARSAESELQAWRLGALAEGRYQRWQGGYGFVRFAPAALGMTARLTDSSTPGGGRLEDNFWLASGDLSGGAAVRVTPAPTPLAVWLRAEGGYSWAASHHLMLAPEAAPQDQAKLAPVDLGTISPRGAFFRFSIALAY